MSVKIRESNPDWLDKLIQKYKDDGQVAVGWPRGGEGASLTYPDGTSVLEVMIWNTFGADINHPGGTPYIIGTDGKAKFVSAERGGKVAGFTKPHKIKIPRRDALTPGGKDASKKANDTLKGYIPKINNGTGTVAEGLEIMGQIAVSSIQNAMTELKEPANAPSTIRKKKGDNNPLIDSGIARQSVSYVVRTS